jgi:drug/metabolite transporter (DMT)-like permease
VFGGLVAAKGLNVPHTAAGWGGVFAIALVGTVVAIITFFAGLERVGPTNASVLSTFEPVTTVVLAAVFMGEAVSPLRIAGGALILMAVILLAKGEFSVNDTPSRPSEAVKELNLSRHPGENRGPVSS